ncbi:MAG: lysophospholipase [Acidobacteria bacterium]|nr:lysophospholipase [Acidobacteriota bacterium]MBI3423037.1 lysophospholipase [Acidobacteriota bacterium]
MKTPTIALICLTCCAMASTTTLAQTQKWAASWAASAHGPYPSGNPSAQPVLDFAFPVAAEGANDQTLRLILRPTLWGKRARLRFSNAFGTRPVTLDDAFIGLQASAGNVAAGTNARVLFNGKPSLTLAPGQVAYGDAVNLTFAKNADDALLNGRKLAVSFHVAGASGPMTWHAKALQTSYLTAPRAGSHGHEESDASFPYTTTSWFFLDALEVLAPADTVVVACFGDSITDGTLSTLNGDDRYPDVLAQRLRAAYGNRVAVINAGIGGNQITGPAQYAPSTPFAGGPSALERLERDVLSLAGVTHILWLEGINDLSQGKTAKAVIAGMEELVNRVRAHGKIKIIGATLTPSLGYNGPAGKPEISAHRQTLNQFIRTSGLFDGVADFDAATVDPQTGSLRAAFQPNSTIGGAGDKLHPNRAGYQAMGNAIDLKWLAPGSHKN